MYSLSHHYRHFDPVARFVYIAAQPGEAIAVATETVKIAADTIPTVEGLGAKITEAKSKVGQAHDKLEAELKKDKLTPKETEKLATLKREAASKFDELGKDHQTELASAGEAKATKATALKEKFNTDIIAIIDSIRTIASEGANDELDDKEEILARKILAKQIPDFGGVEPKEDTPQYEALTAIVATLTKEQIVGKTGAADERINLTPEQGVQAMAKVFDKKLPKEKPEVKAGENEALTAFLEAQDKKGAKIPKVARDAVVKYLATRYEVTQEKDKPLKINGTDIGDMNALMAQLPDNFKTENITAEALTKAATDGTTTTEQLGAIREYLKQVQAEGAEKPKGWMDNIGELVSAITQLIAAWKTQDFDTLGDVAKDLQAGKNPLEEQKKAGDTYTTILEHRFPAPNLEVMLAAYANPRGTEANNLLGSKNTELRGEGITAVTPRFETRYRPAAKEAIKTHLEKELGITLAYVDGSAGRMRLGYTTNDGAEHNIVVGARTDADVLITKNDVKPDPKGTGGKQNVDLGTFKIPADLGNIQKFIQSTNLDTDFPGKKVEVPKVAEAPAAAAVEPAPVVPAPPPAPGTTGEGSQPQSEKVVAAKK